MSGSSRIRAALDMEPPTVPGQLGMPPAPPGCPSSLWEEYPAQDLSPPPPPPPIDGMPPISRRGERLSDNSGEGGSPSGPRKAGLRRRSQDSTDEAAGSGKQLDRNFERLFRGLVRELRELHARHEQRVLERLDAHNERINTALTGQIRLPKPSEAPPRVEAAPRRSGTGASTGPVSTSSAHSLAKCFPAEDCSLCPAGRFSLQAAATSGDDSPRNMPSMASSTFVETTNSELRRMPSSPMDKVQVKPLPRGSRTDTWNKDKNLEVSALYHKKKDVEKTQRRYADASQKLDMSISFSRRAFKVVSHPRFELLLACLIMLNAVSIGVQANWSIQNIGSELPLSMKIVDYFFSACFTIELLVRILAEGRFFASYKNRNFFWNILDAFLVLTAITGDIVSAFITWGANVSVIRLLRVLRLARAIRLIRVLRFFKDLRVMITGIAQSSKSLLWASGLLLLIIYVYAICVSQIVGDHLEALHEDGVRTNDQITLLKAYYGNLFLTVYNLFGSISGGHDWAGIAEPLLEIHPIMGALHMVYVAFAVFCVLNVITGVFVENAFKINNDDEEKVVLDMLESRRQWIQEIKNLFKIVDERNDGYVDLAEFSAIIKDVRVQAIFRRLGLDVEAETAEPLFRMLDYEGRGKVSLDDFAEGIQKVRGNARSIDICQLQLDTRLLKKQTAEVLSLMNSLFQQGAGETTDENDSEV